MHCGISSSSNSTRHIGCVRDKMGRASTHPRTFNVLGVLAQVRNGTGASLDDM